MKILTFLLSGPLQSWGDEARWDRRSTAALPSKSAIVGLLGCCLGYKRGDEQLRELSESIHLAVRADRSGRPLWDYQTVQNPGGKILNSMGKPRGETIITPKQYLQNAAFQVFIYGNDDLLHKCYDAMQHPQWPIYLGRRSCIPALPIIPRIVEYPSIVEALEHYFDEAIKDRSDLMECEIEMSNVDSSSGRLASKMDEVIRADLNQYAERSIWIRTIKRSE